VVALLLSLLVAATGIPRTVDPDLTALAEVRATEITTVYAHRYLRELNNGKWLLWGEVLGYNGGMADPAAAIVDGWMTSPEHRESLTNPRFDSIGCAATQCGVRWYFACIRADAPGGVAAEPPPPPTVTPPPAVRVPPQPGAAPTEPPTMSDTSISNLD
jgi:hypothetical protein